MSNAAFGSVSFIEFKVNATIYQDFVLQSVENCFRDADLIFQKLTHAHAALR